MSSDSSSSVSISKGQIPLEGIDVANAHIFSLTVLMYHLISGIYSSVVHMFIRMPSASIICCICLNLPSHRSFRILNRYVCIICSRDLIIVSFFMSFNTLVGFGDIPVEICSNC